MDLYQLLGYGQLYILAVSVVIMLVCLWLVRIIYLKYYPNMKKNKNIWSYALIGVMRMPLNLLIVSAWLYYTLEYTLLFTYKAIPRYLVELNFAEVKNVLFVLWIVWVILRYLSAVDKKILRLRSKGDLKYDVNYIHVLCKVFKLLTVILGGLSILSILSIPLYHVAAIGGVGTLAIGLAGQSMLKNVFGGFYILIDVPFKVGDWVKSPDRDVEGIVEFIGWRITRIRTLDKRLRYVPNSIFDSISIENVTLMTHRRINEVIGLRYADADKLHLIIPEIEMVLKTYSEIDQQQQTYVRFVEFAGSSLNILVYGFSKTLTRKDFLKFKQDLYFKMIEIVHKHGADFAFPTTTIDFAEQLDVKGLPIKS